MKRKRKRPRRKPLTRLQKALPHRQKTLRRRPPEKQTRQKKKPGQRTRRKTKPGQRTRRRKEPLTRPHPQRAPSLPARPDQPRHGLGTSFESGLEPNDRKNHPGCIPPVYETGQIRPGWFFNCLLPCLQTAGACSFSPPPAAASRPDDPVYPRRSHRTHP